MLPAVVAVAPQQFSGGWGSARTRIEERNIYFAPRERAVDERQIADNCRQEPEAEATFGDDQRARETRAWEYVTEPQREECGAAQIKIGPEAWLRARGIDGRPCPVLHQAKTENKADGPDTD